MKTTTFQMCARLREIALDCGKLRSLRGLIFLESVTVSENSRRARFAKKHIRTSKQPEINARLKIKVYIYI